jgi:ATP-dependent protease HslVU (ClpYQ) peptidase subunit
MEYILRVVEVFMWICNKNRQLINIERVGRLSVLKGKSYYDDNAVLQTYYYICADNNKIIKTANEGDVLEELNNIVTSISSGKNLYVASGLVMNEDDQGNLID